MVRKFKALAAAVSGGLLFVGCTSSALAASNRQAKDVAAIEAHFDVLTEMMAKGETATKIVEEVYWPDAMSSIEGMETLLRGHAQLTPVMQAAVKEGVGTKCKFTFVGAIVISGSLASSLGNVVCKDPASGQEQPSRALYVWEKRMGHWRVIREHVSTGNLK
jgi:ketosteroid isomerase-like protein